MEFWLLKTEPDTFSFTDLENQKKTNWDGVRNYQARNNLKKMKKNDLALIYHSVKEKSVVGIAKISKEAFIEPTPNETKGDWVQVEIMPYKKVNRPLILDEIKKTKTLKNLPLIKQSRLSVMPISQTEFLEILKLTQTKLPPFYE